MKIPQNKAFFRKTDGLSGWYYQVPDLDQGTSIIYAEIKGNHGQSIIREKPRFYFIISGTGEFVINKEKTIAKKGDLLVIPPFATYSYNAKSRILKLVLFMDYLIDLTKLSPR